MAHIIKSFTHSCILALCLLFFLVCFINAQETFQLAAEDSIITNMIQEAELLVKQGKYSDALKKYEKANEIKESANVFKSIGTVYLKRAKSLDAIDMKPAYKNIRKEHYVELSVFSFWEALSLEPKNMEVINLLAEVYKYYSDSVVSRRDASEMKRALSDNASAEEISLAIELIEEGHFLYKQQMYDDAIKKYEESAQIRQFSEAFKGLGLAYIQRAKDLNKEMATPIRASKKNSYFEESVKNFIRAISIEPNNLELRYLLADAFIFKNDTESLELAEALLEQITAVNSSYKDALIRLSVVYRNLNKNDKTKKVLNAYLGENKTDPMALFQLSKAALTEENYDEAADYLIMSFNNLGDEQTVSEIYEEMEMLFSDRDRDDFYNSKHKGKFLKKFWLEKDPDPETEVNERLIEHLKRVSYASKSFITQSTHGAYDDRGRIYIKYGEPDNKYISGGDLRIYSNESWIYYWAIGDYNKGLFFDFANKGGKGYELVKHLGEAVIYGSTINNPDLYMERAWLDENIYGELAFKANAMPGGDMSDFVHNFIFKKEDAIRNAPPEAYIFHDETQPLFVLTSSASFRGENGKTRQEIYYSFPLKDIKFNKEDEYKKASFDEFVVLKNIDNKNISKNKKSVALKFDKKQNLKKNSHIDQINIEVPYQEEDYICFLKIESSTDDHLGLIYHEMSNKDYTGRLLMMSDIEFAYSIDPASVRDKFTKNGLDIIPHTGGVINKEENIFIYFEIYNLVLDTKGDGSYKVEYVVRKRNSRGKGKKKIFNVFGREVSNKKAGDKETISSSWVESTKNQDTFSWQSIDMSGLSEGLYDLTIKITDLVAKKSISSGYGFILGKK